MEERNLIPFVIGVLKTHNNKNVKEYYIKPLERSWQYTIQLYIIRLKRIVYKYWYKWMKN